MYNSECLAFLTCKRRTYDQEPEVTQASTFVGLDGDRSQDMFPKDTSN